MENAIVVEKLQAGQDVVYKARGPWRDAAGPG